MIRTGSPALPSHARRLSHLAALAPLLIATVALGQPQAGSQAQPKPRPAPAAEPQKPVTNRDPSAADVVATPMTDLNLRKGEIPAALLAAEADPYGLPGGARCPALIAEVQQLDTVLGDDIDLAQGARARLSAGKVAQSVVGSFIPFRGVIREVSGASEQERRLQSAINAGVARRGFLKGVGLQRDCARPARPATAPAPAPAPVPAAKVQPAPVRPASARPVQGKPGR
ncbi:hypothetical protein ACFOD9_07985 [Novosphingobium bradum]|uniref:Uncharacterized protein n=1 Tax=Novosphingobium bradum TaxID=1737444 RepID=A0ABV7IQG1_9SPHN